MTASETERVNVVTCRLIGHDWPNEALVCARCGLKWSDWTRTVTEAVKFEEIKRAWGEDWNNGQP